MIVRGRSRFTAVSLLSSYAAAVTTASSSTAIQSTPTASPTLVGCFSSFKPLVKQDTYQYQSSGHCWGVCSDINKAVLGLANGVSCWCGDELPAADSKVPASNCDTPCKGYDLEDCGGGTEYFTIWLTGTESNVPNYNGDGSLPSTSSTSSAVPATTSTNSETGSTTMSTPDPTSSSEPNSDANRAGNIAERIRSHGRQRTILGVVLGLTAFTAIVAAALLVWCCARRRRRKHGGQLFQRRKAPSLSEAPLATNVDSMSTISTSTYSSRRSPAFVERTGVAIAAMQRALNPDARSPHEEPASNASKRVKKPRPKLQTTSTELEAQDYRNVIDHQSIETYQSPVSPILPAQSPLAGIIQQSLKQPKSLAVMVSTDELTSPTSTLAAEVNRKSTQAVMIHYPSWSEVDGFDFSGEANNSDGKQRRATWHPFRERREGRYELA